MVKIYDIETDQEIEREMTSDELKQYEKDILDAKNQSKNELAKATQKASLLEKLGITEDEAKLLLS